MTIFEISKESFKSTNTNFFGHAELVFEILKLPRSKIWSPKSDQKIVKHYKNNTNVLLTMKIHGITRGPLRDQQGQLSPRLSFFHGGVMLCALIIVGVYDSAHFGLCAHYGNRGNDATRLRKLLCFVW